ncbi:hypothetical protein ACTFIY_003620 [Dictyostelium cf. discoideum]
MSAIGDKESAIFKEKNFGGQKWSLKNGSRYGNQAGALRSLKVGKFCKINVWDKNGTMETYLGGDYPDITDKIPNVDIVQAIDVEFKFSVDVRLKHTVKGRDPNAFQLTVIPYQLKSVEIVSGGDYSGVQIPALNPPDAEIVCQVSIRELAWPGQTFANGSIYFKYNPSNNTLSYRKTEGWPHNCDIVQDDVSGFTITLISIE